MRATTKPESADRGTLPDAGWGIGPVARFFMRPPEP